MRDETTTYEIRSSQHERRLWRENTDLTSGELEPPIRKQELAIKFVDLGDQGITTGTGYNHEGWCICRQILEDYLGDPAKAERLALPLLAEWLQHCGPTARINGYRLLDVLERIETKFAESANEEG